MSDKKCLNRNRIKRQFEITLLVFVIFSIGILAGVAIVKNSNTCKVTKCIEDTQICVGSDYIILEGLYKGNIGKIVDITQSYSGNRYSRVTLKLCNGETTSVLIDKEE